MYKIIRFIGKLYLRIFYRIKYYGRENIPKDGGYLVCSNHISNLDVVIINVNFKKRVHWMAKEELFKIPIFVQIIKAFGAYPVARGKGDGKAVQKTLDLLAENKFVGIFPHGTRTKGKDISQMRAKYGAAKFAIQSKKPVMPIGIAGSGKLFSKIKVVFGEAYYIESEPDKEYTKDEYQVMSQKIIDNIYKMIEDTV